MDLMKEILATVKDILNLVREVKAHTEEIKSIKRNQEELYQKLELVEAKVDRIGNDVAIIKERLDVWGEIMKLKETVARIEEKLKAT